MKCIFGVVMSLNLIQFGVHLIDVSGYIILFLLLPSS